MPGFVVPTTCNNFCGILPLHLGMKVSFLLASHYTGTLWGSTWHRLEARACPGNWELLLLIHLLLSWACCVQPPSKWHCSHVLHSSVEVMRLLCSCWDLNRLFPSMGSVRTLCDLGWQPGAAYSSARLKARHRAVQPCLRLALALKYCWAQVL